MYSRIEKMHIDDIHKQVIQKYGIDKLFTWFNPPTSKLLERLHVGIVCSYDDMKGYGFIKDLDDRQEYFFHVSSLSKAFYIVEHEQYNKELIHRYLIHHYCSVVQSSLEYDRIVKQLLSAGKESTTITNHCKYGYYTTRIDAAFPQKVNIIDTSISRYPQISYATLVCFEASNSKAINLFTPGECKERLLSHKDSYNDIIWGILYHFMPSISINLLYEAPNDIDKKFANYFRQIPKLIEYIDSFDIKPLISRLKLRLNVDGSPATTRDLDPYSISLVGESVDRGQPIPGTDIKEDVFAVYASSIYVQLSPTIDNYGCPSLSSFPYYEPYRPMMDNYIHKREQLNRERGNMIYDEYSTAQIDIWEQCFGPFREEQKQSLLNKYNKKEHFMYYIYNWANQIARQFFFRLEDHYEQFVKYEYILKYDNSSPRLRNSIKIDFGNGNKVFEYDDKYAGKYRGAHYYGTFDINKSFDDTAQMLLSKNTIDRMNTELREYYYELFVKHSLDVANSFNKDWLR